MLQDDLSVCKHNVLCYESSAHASKAGFAPPCREDLLQAATLSDALTDMQEIRPGTFPAPLVLPGDDIAFDPPNKRDLQDLKSWDCLMKRRRPPGRRTIYVARPPLALREVLDVQTWTSSNSEFWQEGLSNEPEPAMSPPDPKDILNYLSAFYKGLSVKFLPQPLSFITWKDDKAVESPAISYVGLSIGRECIRIRARRPEDNVFQRQLNVNDLTDALISVLPADAMALLLVVNHDIYESPEDDFICGRAYGGSRIAVVSTARYNPALDGHQGVERYHAWPASHCKSYMDAVCREDEGGLPPPKKRSRKTNKPKTQRLVNGKANEEQTALRAAVTAYRSLPSPLLYSSVKDLEGMWLGRVCQTASHELGHCLGIDHCAYYACMMQGTASLVEDVGQPPYLCPVDDKKVEIITGLGDREAQLRALAVFCRSFPTVHMFVAFGAWIQHRLHEDNCQ